MKNKKIKVIKKAELETAKVVPPKKERTNQENAREVVTNVSGWVAEFQRKKREETKTALKNLLPKTMQTDGA
ncbi:MAG: hypothetical protein ACK5NT_13510 [Pyrinomonadaceae bacterium]